MSRVVIAEVVVAALVVGLLATVVSGLVRLTRRGPGRRPVLGPALLDGALAASVAAVLVATLSPLELLGSRLDAPSEVNLRPLEALRGAPEVYAVVNALLLVPTTLLLALRWRRAGVIRLTLAGAVMSLAIELAQLVHPIRGTNVDDLALNTAGAAVAAVCGVLVRLLVRRSAGDRTQPPARSAAREVSAAGPPR